MTTADIERIQIIATTKDGEYILGVSDNEELIAAVAIYCKFQKLKKEYFEQCSLKELLEE